MESLIKMKEGLGETSYAKNSSVQKQATDIIKHMIINSAVDAYLAKTPTSMVIADLGCGSGPNTYYLLIDIVNAIIRSSCEASRQQPEFQVFLNDLPTNDFNSLFTNMPEFMGKLRNCGRNPPSVFLTGVPGSFYGRLFPENSLHFAYSCCSIHWLSKVPPGLFDESGNALNKGNINVSEASPPAVATAFSKQFQRDFNNLLRSRSAELVSDGRFVLLMMGRKNHRYLENCINLVWDVLAQSLANMTSQKVVEEEKVDSYNVPLYTPSLKEIEDEVLREGSFTIDHAQVVETISSTGDPKKDAWDTTMLMRATQEPMIRNHFQFGDEVINKVFQKYCEMLEELLEKKEVINWVYLVVSLRKLY